MSYDEDDDDKFIEKTLTKQLNRAGNAANPVKGKEMSYHPKELVKGKPVLTKDESDSITELQELRKQQAIFKKKNNVQGYAIDEIKPEGNRLVIDQDKVNERKQHDKDLVKKMYDEEKKSARGVKHTIEGRTQLFRNEN